MKPGHIGATTLIVVLLLSVFAVCGFKVCAQDRVAETDAALFVGDIALSERIPFSFVYGDQSSSALLAGIKPTVKTIEESTTVRQVEKTWRCEDGLVVTLKATYYKDFGANEWTTYITYAGKKKSKVIFNLYGIDNLLPVLANKEVIIHTNKGDDCTKFSYEPYDIVLNQGQREVFYPSQGGQPSGKSTTGDRGWPYWNIQNGNNGWILVVGWPGTWQSTFSRESKDAFRVKAGQKSFHAVLNAGETIRTPLVCVLPWDAADVATSQNIWRRFYLAHIIPHFNGKPEPPATEIQSGLNEQSVEQTQKYIKAGIKPRICWKDTGWYPTNTGNWLETGEWRLDPKKFTNGIKPFSDWAHQQDIECLLWFEPERVKGDNMLSRNHQDWLLPVTGWKTKILNLGNPECLNWLVNHIDKMITDNGLDWYREDMNESGPYAAWLQADFKAGKDRQGITENLYVQGHLAFWDSLKQRHPDLHIDACASGGRRNDLETMHRAVPLLRSDYQWKKMGADYIIGNQAHPWALSAWFPFQGSAVYEYEPYKYRSFYLPCFGMGYMKDDNETAIIRAYNECVQIQPMMLYGDYWPMTPYSLEDDVWIAWQFNRETEGDGCVQAFRRENCIEKYVRVKLRGLDARGIYQITDFDSHKKVRVSGRKLMITGYRIQIQEQPGAAILVYEKVM